nr:tyrosine-type recombinase/integrase [Saezia sanguinis]
MQAQRRIYGDTLRTWINPATCQPWTTESQLRKTLWVPLIKRAGIRYRNPYQCRHTYASTLLTAGANPFWLVTQMGHADVEMIFKIYGKWIHENFKQAGKFTPISHQQENTHST